MFDFLLGKDKDQIDREYSKAISDTKQAKANAEYNYDYNKALYDANKDYFDKLGVKDPSSYYYNDKGQYTNALSDTMSLYDKYLNDLNKEREDVARQNKYNIFGNGLIGGLLNPFHQAGTAAQDFVTSGTREWDRGNRDIVSDLGAIGEVGLDLATLGSASGASAGAKTLGKTVGKGALLGASYGGLGSLADMGSKNFNLGGLLGSAALGGALGGGLSAAGYGVNKLAGRAQATRDLSNMYQQYLAEQNPNALYIPSSNAQPSSQEWLLNRGKLARTKLGQAIQGIGDTISYKNMMGNGIGSKAKNIANKVANSKVGTKASNLLKTKKGKIGLGIGGGLLLSQILGGRNQNQNNMTDEELYNYIVKGEQ